MQTIRGIPILTLVLCLALASCIRLVGVGPPGDGDADGDVDGDADGDADGDSDASITDGAPPDATTDSGPRDGWPTPCHVDDRIGQLVPEDSKVGIYDMNEVEDEWTFTDCEARGPEVVMAASFSGSANNITLAVRGAGEFHVGYFDASVMSSDCRVATNCYPVGSDGSVYFPGLTPGSYYFFVEQSVASDDAVITVTLTHW